MKCKACGNELTAIVGNRPVAICFHFLCETCVTVNNTCPICNAKTDLEGEARIHSDLLEELQQSSSKSSVKFPCDNHLDRSVEFFCSTHCSMVCGTCAWDHFDHRDSVNRYNIDDISADITKINSCVENVVNQCQEMKSSIKPESIKQGDLYKVMSHACDFVMKHGDADDSTGLKFKVTSSKTPVIDSVILGNTEKVKFQELVGNDKKLKLIFRATRDGDKAADFHRCCDNKGSTVVLVYAKNCKFGGYLTDSWGKPTPTQWYPGRSDDYLFWLEPPFKLHCKDGVPEGHYDHPSNGPVMGNGHDLILYPCCLSNESSYAKAGHSYGIGETEKCRYFTDLDKFRVQEYEVFAVE